MSIFPVIPFKEGETNDTPKLFTNTDKEDFEFSYKGSDDRWIKYVIKPNETRTFPKYLVNYAATHLTKKIMKREAFAAEPDEKIRKMGLIKWDNEEEAKELSAKMVAKNYKDDIVLSEPKIEKEEEKKEEVETEDNPLKCDVCGFVSKSKFGLQAHKRLKHR